MTVKELTYLLRGFSPDTLVFTAGCPAHECKGLSPADGVSACQAELSLNDHDDRVLVEGVAIGRNESAEHEYAVAKQAMKKLTQWLVLSGALVHLGAF